MRRGKPILGALLADPRIRSVELAFAGFNMAEYGVWVSMLVYAYGRGGATIAAIVAVAQLIPASLVAPLAARVSDSRGGAAALAGGYRLQAAALGTTSLLLFVGAPTLLVYAAAIVAAGAVTITRPAQAALLPTLVETREQLTAVNVLSGWVENLSVLVGPALAGLLIAARGPAAAIGAFALLVAASARVVAAPAVQERIPPPRDHTEHERGAGVRDALLALRDDRDLVALVALLGVQYLVIGLLDVLLVVLAITVLGIGPSGAGYLSAAFGAGGVLGSLAALSLIGRDRLAGPLVGAAVGWALMLVVLGSWPTVLGAFLLLIACGSARSLLDVSGRTILLRAAPEALRGRLFGLLEGVAMLGLALGSILVPLLVSLGSPGLALVAAGLLLSAMALAPIGSLRRLDSESADLPLRLLPVVLAR